MDEIQQLAMNAIAVLSPYLAKGGDELASSVGKDLWTFTKNIFHSDREKKTLDELQNSPYNPVVQGKIAGKLEDILEGNSELVNQLRLILSRSVNLEKNNVQTIIGDNNTGIQDIKGGNFTIN